jgi:hypothetical protein
MTDLIYQAVLKEAAKLVTRHQRYAFELSEHLRRCERRSGIPRPKQVRRPPYWDRDKGFNPYHVRKHAKTIAYAIDRALRDGTYNPRPAAVYQLPKDDGGWRDVSVFQVADQAVANVVYKRLLDKNKGRFSSRCFAYRRDLTVHDAVLHLASSFAGHRRLFVAEYDFKKYFDSLSHDHIARVLADKRFSVTDRERRLIWSFLKSSAYRVADYSLQQRSDRTKGIPQGISISLFIANLAAYPLDRLLEGLRVDFARYADDTLIWAEDYGEVCRAVTLLSEAADQMGVEFNFKKSDGVRLVVDEGAKAELEATTSVDFVGYRISFRKVGIRQKTVNRIKNHLAYLVYANLLQQRPASENAVLARVAGASDLDYVVMIAQIRRYLYGNLTETMLAKFSTGDTPRMQYKGLMSFYPIVDDIDQLQSLDGWLLHTVCTSLRQRTAAFLAAGATDLPFPHNRPKEELVQGVAGESRLPSFVRIAALL